MGIDRIGKGGGATPPIDTTPAGVGAPRAAEPSRAFRVEPSRADAAVPVDAARPSPLDRLRSGEIDMNGYLDLKVDEATTHLGTLPPAELTAVRNMLRDQLATDPALADLVEQATGRPPTPPEED
jgi:hypothetical protein